MGLATVENSQQLKAMVAKVLQLPERKMSRVLELGRLYQESFDADEKAEIVAVLAEIIQPELCGIEWPRGAAVAIDDTVDEVSARRVEAYRKSVGKRIRAARKQIKMTQDELAEKSGLPQSHICRLEQGKHAATEDTIIRIATALGVPAGTLDPAF